ncbi:MAG: hypothetical protein AAF497_28290 [Planctomycetota bacterium]
MVKRSVTVGLATILLIVGSSAPAGIVVQDKEWLDPSTVVGVSYNDVASVCDEANGNCVGSILGTDITGFVWANAIEISELFQDIGSGYPGGVTSVFNEPSTWGSAFFDDRGFVNMVPSVDLRVSFGMIRDTLGDPLGSTILFGAVFHNVQDDRDTATIDPFFGFKRDRAENWGPWLFRDVELPAVPLPPASLLFPFGVTAIVVLRRHISREKH